MVRLLRGLLLRNPRVIHDQIATKVDLQRSDIEHAVDVKGDVDIEGRGSRVWRSPLHLESRNTDLRVAQVPGTITMDLGDLTGSNLIGPIRLVTRSKDIHLDGFTQSLELETERGDIDLKPGKAPLSKIDAKSRSGNIDLELPESAKFDLKATTSRGEVRNDFGPAIQSETSGPGASLKGKVGEGPAITLRTERGTVSVKKS
jgi:DUF4097 and DUF4098 domain-containing protein YvlB